MSILVPFSAVFSIFFQLALSDSVFFFGEKIFFSDFFRKAVTIGLSNSTGFFVYSAIEIVLCTLFWLSLFISD